MPFVIMGRGEEKGEGRWGAGGREEVKGGHGNIGSQ